jgi:surface polysaccharide O-acyltransferase-like enzyme
VAVVATHVSDLFLLSDASPAGERAAFALVRNGSVPFVLVAGFLFQHLSEDFSYQRYLRTKCLHVLLPYLIMSLPALIHQYLRQSEAMAGTQAAGWVATLMSGLVACLTGAQMAVPFWFIPMMGVFYLAAPLVLLIDRRPRLYWIILPSILLATLIHRSLGHRLLWQSAVYFLPVYLMGCWASHFRVPLLVYLQRRRWPAAGVFVTLTIVEVAVLRQYGPIFSATPFSLERGVFDLDLVAKLVGSLLVLELLHAYHAKVPGWFGALAGASFGIFFIHQYLIDLLSGIALRLHIDIAHVAVPAFIVLTPLVTAGSYLLVRLGRRVFGRRSRMIIGS